MRGSPDLVFRNINSGQVLIVEIKLSKMKIPSNLWPNVWAQLWCYSQIAIAKNAPEVTVTGEVWAEGIFNLRRRSPVMSLVLRSVVRRNPREAAFDRFFRSLFEIYSGN